MHRSKLYFLLLTCPLLACADDIPEVVTDGSSSDDGDTTSSMTVNPTTVTLSDTDTTTTSLDSTGEPDSSSGEPGSSSSGEPGSSSSGEPGSSSSGEPGSSSSGGAACGDGMQDAAEQCDGADLDGYNCVTLGPAFTGGTLACADDCSFDTSACFICGNDAVDGPEPCDGADLDGNTCDSLGLGFIGGTLACAVDCSFDTSACNACGNGVVDAGETCDGMDLGGSGCADLGMGFTGGALGCNAACDYDTAACTSVPYPLAGEVIVTEIMQNPFTLADLDGEWFEIHNPAMGASFQLGTCAVEGAADVGFTIDIDMVIGPGEYRIFSTDTMVDQGFVPDYQWAEASFNLVNNAVDTVRLVCNGIIVDEVTWDDGATFPDPNGQSMSLDPGSYDAAANDIGANWCAASTSYNGDFGTPGADNTVCGGVVDYPIDFCRLQFPDVIDEIQGTNVDVFGRLYSGGLTDLSGVNDPAPGVIGYVGYGPDGTDPLVDATWVWTAGVPNPGYGPASPGYEANNDEYQAVLSVPVPGTYDFAFRFSGDNGATFTYCDGQPAGNSDGYQPANAGQMTASPGGAPANLYFSEYVEGGSNNKAFEIYNASGGMVDLTGCEVRFYFNASVAAGTTITLAGNIAADDVQVVCDNSIIDVTNCDVLDPSVSWFNGDDAIELVCSGTTLDVIGQIGFDPGTEWLVGVVGTQNETLRRNCAVTTGDINGADVFDPSLEWASFPQDTFADLGQYVCP